MNNNDSMNEIFKIKDDISKKYSSMTIDEIKKEESKSFDWFLNAIGKNKDEIIVKK